MCIHEITNSDDWAGSAEDTRPKRVFVVSDVAPDELIVDATNMAPPIGDVHRGVTCISKEARALGTQENGSCLFLVVCTYN